MRAKQIDVLADDNDTYFIEVFADDGAKTSLTVPAVWGGGLRWRSVDLPPTMTMRPIERVEIRPGQGDGVFAVRALVLGASLIWIALC